MSRQCADGNVTPNRPVLQPHTLPPDRRDKPLPTHKTAPLLMNGNEYADAGRLLWRPPTDAKMA